MELSLRKFEIRQFQAKELDIAALGCRVTVNDGWVDKEAKGLEQHRQLREKGGRAAGPEHVVDYLKPVPAHE